MEQKKTRRVHSRSAAEFLPSSLTLPALTDAATRCKGCDLYKQATQTVFGEGASHASVMFVGEIPGDHEDRQGRPFVGPAGRILDNALAEVGISRESVYVTNAVKHFKWEPQGRRRKHKKPLASEIAACRPWLAAEIEVTQPKIIVCLGATAAQSVFGRPVRVRDTRGQFLKSYFGPEAFVTSHPSAVLRHPDKEEQQQEYARLVADLKAVHRKMRTL
jgi:DNA polymerase